MLIVWIVLDIALAIVLWLVFWRLVTLFVERSSRQKQFIEGIVPQAPPSGFYHGAAYLLGNRPVPWLGKSFESENAKGFNIFTPKGASIIKFLTPLYRLFRVNAEGNTDAYYFKTSIGPGLKDKNIDVFKLDYDPPENPFLIRIILDEVVE